MHRSSRNLKSEHNHDARGIKLQNLTPDLVQQILYSEDLTALMHQSRALTESQFQNSCEFCSICNVKSGRCAGNCAWCSQSVKHNCAIPVYKVKNEAECLQEAAAAKNHQASRFGLVSSGIRPSKIDFDQLLRNVSSLVKHSGVQICASFGLMSREQLQALKDAGLTRIHCNLETAPSFFPQVCTSHTIEEKIHTIKTAQELGLEVCSGVLFNMGESMAQRVEVAQALSELQPDSIPINVLHPIAGTALQDRPPMSSDELIRSVLLLRFACPKAVLRLAGGRVMLDEKTTAALLQLGINSAIIGDFLTTQGFSPQSDRERFAAAGYVNSAGKSDFSA